MSYLISAIIFLTCTAYIPGKPFWLVQLYAFKIGVLTAWLISLGMKSVRNVSNIWLNVLIGYAFLQVLLLQGQPQQVALEPLVNVFLGLILYYTIASYLLDIKPVLRGICWAVGAQFIIVLLQITGYDPICLNDGGLHNTHMVGLYGAKYLLGSWMALATPILLFNKRIIFGVISAILCICSFSFASIGLLVLSMLIGLFLVNRNAFKISLVVVGIIGAVLYFGYFNKSPYYTDQNNRQSLHPTSIQYKIGSRIHLQTKFLPILFAKPLTGFGLGSFKFIGSQIVNPSTDKYGTMTDAWNDYLEQGVQQGLLWIVIFLGLCWDTIKRFKKSVICPATVGIFCSLLLIPTSMLFHDVLNHASMNTLSICIFAVFAIRSAGYETVN